VITLKIIYDTKFGIETTSPLRLNCSLRQGTFFDAPCIAVEASVCLNSVTTVFLLAKSSHFLVRITPAVRTHGSHFQFAFYRFAISQFANYQTRLGRHSDTAAVCLGLAIKTHSGHVSKPLIRHTVTVSRHTVKRKLIKVNYSDNYGNFYGPVFRLDRVRVI